MDAIARELEAAGSRVRRKICGAIAVSSVIPLLVLVYTIHAYLVPHLDPVEHARELVAVQALVVFTGLLMAAGAVVIWDVASAVARVSQAVGAAGAIGGVRVRTDEVGAVIDGVARMLGTIEQQADEIHQFTGRLQGAYRELELTNARLREFSFRDEVTGLYNRRFFTVRLEEEISRYRRFSHPVSVVLLDVDDFKQVNDAGGHGAGDEALRAVADLLVRHSRGINVVCRYGGDEFAVLLVETGKDSARAYAERIRHVLASEDVLPGRRLTASFGIACVPEDTAPAMEDLMRAADDGLYAAKRRGKNRVGAPEDVAQIERVEIGAR